MTIAEKILNAVGLHLGENQNAVFSRNDILQKTDIQRGSFDPTFQGMREDQPGGAPMQNQKYRNVFRQVEQGKYVLTEYGKGLLLIGCPDVDYPRPTLTISSVSKEIGGQSQDESSELTGSEIHVLESIQKILERIAPGRFVCNERKSNGKSVIKKPVDLQVANKISRKSVMVIEVANVNTTQLVGETCRLYYDCCPLKLLILGDRNIPREGKLQCEKLLARLYGQEDIQDTPARVANYDDIIDIETCLRDLLLI